MIHLIYFSVQWKPTLISYFYFPCLGAGRYREGGGILLGDRYKIFIGFGASFLDKRSLPGGPV